MPERPGFDAPVLESVIRQTVNFVANYSKQQQKKNENNLYVKKSQSKIYRVYGTNNMRSFYSSVFGRENIDF